MFRKPSYKVSIQIVEGTTSQYPLLPERPSCMAVTKLKNSLVALPTITPSTICESGVGVTKDRHA